jgi:aminopeptidase N
MKLHENREHFCRHRLHNHGPAAPQQAPANLGGVGDLYYPTLGNSGYDAKHYDVSLKVDPDSNQVEGKTSIKARSTQSLDHFHLDFSGMKVEKVIVNGNAAQFKREESELIITPKAAIGSDQEFQVEVQYSGKPEAKQSFSGDFLVGWKNNGHGVVVDSQPDGGQTWIPCNDHPLDKATYSYHVEVPKPFVVAANGTLVQLEDKGENQVYHWESKDPLASYLATVNIGDYVVEHQTGPNGLPIRNYYPPELKDKASFDFARTGEMIGVFSKLFGPYPFETYGVVVVNDPKAVSGAMEMQTMSLFEPAMVTGDRANEDVVAHELAHHWFGNLVSLGQWRDLWLHEGFASYAEWLWLEHTEGAEALDKHAEKIHDRLASRPGITIGEPPKDDLFNGQVYMKGALALHALRREVGDEAFFTGIRSYVQEHAGEGEKNVSVEDFQKAIEATSQKPLADFFQNWLYETQLPDMPKAA